jgi:hypothetical protein
VKRESERLKQGIESNRSSGESEAWSALSNLSLMINLSRCVLDLLRHAES